MNRNAANIFWRASILGMLSILSVGMWAQTTHQVDVNRGTVTYASGNDLIVRMEDGTVKHFVVPSDYTLTIDGKQVGVGDLTPGTKLTQTIITTTGEQLVTDVRTVDAKVLEAKAPYLTIASGDTIKRVKVPMGTKFNVDGKDMTLADLKEGMRVKGTVVTTVPTTVVSRARQVTGETPAKKAVATPVAIGVLLIEETDLPK